MDYKTYTNGRGETATANGFDVWRGTDTDSTTRSVNALQPIETIFPLCALVDSDIRLNVIANDCIVNRAPRITPFDYAETQLFKDVWNVATALRNGGASVIEVAFSAELGVFSRPVFIVNRDSVDRVTVFAQSFTDETVATIPYSAFNNSIGTPIAYYAALQSCIIVTGHYSDRQVGLPIVITPDGVEHDVADRSSDAALMIALRARTPWFKNSLGDMPF